MRARQVQALRIAVSATLLVLVWHLVDGDRLLSVLRTIDVTLLCAAVAVTVPMHLLSALRWQFTCAQIGLPLSLYQAIREYYLASWLNCVLPGGVTGDAVRVWRQGAAGHAAQTVSFRPPTTALLIRFRQPLHGVFIERFAGQCAMVAVLAAGMAVNYSRLTPLRDALLAVTAIIVLAGVVWSVLVACARSSIESTHGWRRLVHELQADARRAFSPGRVLSLQLALSLMVVATYLTTFWLAALAVHAPLNLATALLAIPLVLTAMTLPVSVGGLGLRETAAAVLWPAFSMPASDGAASALTYGVVILIGALPGAAVVVQRRSTSKSH